MNSKLMFSLIAVIAVLLISAFVFRSWLEVHDDRLALQATLENQKKIIATADETQRQRQLDLQSALAQIQQLERQVQTPQQIVRELPQYLSLLQPIQLIPPSATQPGSGLPPGQGTALPEKSQAASPAASPSVASETAPPIQESFAQIPAADLKPLYDFVQDCRACRAQLAATRADLSDEQAKSAALATERDAAIKAAKGGGLWKRIRRNAKWLAVGAGVGYALARLH